eukprot:364100-Chlamydomonas_euryale.AAC.51
MSGTVPHLPHVLTTSSRLIGSACRPRLRLTYVKRDDSSMRPPLVSRVAQHACALVYIRIGMAGVEGEGGQQVWTRDCTEYQCWQHPALW